MTVTTGILTKFFVVRGMRHGNGIIVRNGKTTIPLFFIRSVEVLVEVLSV